MISALRVQRETFHELPTFPIECPFVFQNGGQVGRTSQLMPALFGKHGHKMATVFGRAWRVRLGDCRELQPLFASVIRRPPSPKMRGDFRSGVHDPEAICFPSRGSRVRAPSPAPDTISRTSIRSFSGGLGPRPICRSPKLTFPQGIGPAIRWPQCLQSSHAPSPPSRFAASIPARSSSEIAVVERSPWPQYATASDPLRGNDAQVTQGEIYNRHPRPSPHMRRAPVASSSGCVPLPR